MEFAVLLHGSALVWIHWINFYIPGLLIGGATINLSLYFRANYQYSPNTFTMTLSILESQNDSESATLQIPPGEWVLVSFEAN